MIYFFCALTLGVVFYFFRSIGHYDILISFEFLFLMPFAFFLASHFVKILRLREAQIDENKTLAPIVGSHLFSEALASTLFFFLKDVYMILFSAFAFQNRFSFISRLFVLRSIDASFYLLISFLISGFYEPFINVVRFDLFIYLILICTFLFFLRKNIEGIELNRIFLLSGLGWALDIIAFYSFLVVTSNGKNVTWVDALISFFTKFSILTDPYVKWFSLILIMASIPVLFILGKRKL